MSSAVFTKLPRFDVEPVRRPGEWLREINADDAIDSVSLPAAGSFEPDYADEPMQAMEFATAEPSAPDNSALDAVLSSLGEVIGRIDKESQLHAVETARSLSAQLFPELSRLFLAEEIVRVLPGLLPSAAPVVSIYARPPLAEQLAELITSHPALEGRCTVVPSEEHAEGRADVSWRAGGVTFDFGSLLTACLGHLELTHKPKTE